MGVLRRRVLKFGGTSVGQAAPLRSALAIVAAAAAERPVVVVVSALSGVTDALEAAVAGAAARRLDANGFVAAVGARHATLLESVASGRPAARARDRRALAARRGFGAARVRRRCGGRDTRRPRQGSGRRRAALGARSSRRASRRSASRRTRWTRRSIVRTDASFAEAHVDLASTRGLARDVLAGFGLAAVPVVTGFIGATEDGRDDAPRPRRVRPHSRDPRLGGGRGARRDLVRRPRRPRAPTRALVPTAATIPWLSYADATALARRGAKVLHPRTLEPLEEAGIPVFVGHTLRPDGPGTWIAAEPVRPLRGGGGRTAA